MNNIFTFIFESLRDIFNFLDFNLPGISLTFMDFLLLVIIIPIIFKLVKGAIGESGDGLIFGSFDYLSNNVENFKNLSYKQYDSYFNDKHIRKVRKNHDEQLHVVKSLKESRRD